MTTGHLNTVGEALAHELDIYEEGSPSHLCSVCYQWILTVKKMEDDVEVWQTWNSNDFLFTLKAETMDPTIEIM